LRSGGEALTVSGPTETDMYLSEVNQGDSKPAITPAAPSRRASEDMELLRFAATLNKELAQPLGRYYWPDMLLSAVLGYGALFLAMVAGPVVAIVAGIAAILLLYRASLFIHEISHMKRDALPGFHGVWNLLVGVPLMIPSFMYEGVHTLHHQRQRYGTALDPEYLPLSHMRPVTLLVFMLVAAAAPVGFLLRNAVLVPLSFLLPPLRRVVMERYSALAINPAFRRPEPDDRLRRSWTFWDIVAAIWAIGVVALTATGVVPLRAFLTYMAVISGAMIINQIRTLVAHLWENEGEEMSITDQYLDSVNVPPPGVLPALWAPVGLRYHALHHLLPALPYHALGEAHRRLIAAMPVGTAYHGANYPDLGGLVGRLVASSRRSAR